MKSIAEKEIALKLKNCSNSDMGKVLIRRSYKRREVDIVGVTKIKNLAGAIQA